MDALLPDEKLYWHQTWDRIRQVMEKPVQIFSWRGSKRVIHVLRSWVLVVWGDGRITPLMADQVLWLGKVGASSYRAQSLAKLASDGGWLTAIAEGMKWEMVHAHCSWAIQ